jgi:hypothetical protein
LQSTLKVNFTSRILVRPAQAKQTIGSEQRLNDAAFYSDRVRRHRLQKLALHPRLGVYSTSARARANTMPPHTRVCVQSHDMRGASALAYAQHVRRLCALRVYARHGSHNFGQLLTRAQPKTSVETAALQHSNSNTLC